MSILERTEDALFLWRNGRHEGAFLSILVAVAATSRIRYPDRKSVRDRDAFEQYLASAHSVRINVEFRGAIHPIERILYKWLRCELVHEGGFPVDVEFFSHPQSDSLVVRAGGSPEFKLKLSDSWFQHLIDAVVTAPENSGMFASWQN